jgi:hypothetical protein
MSDGTFSKWKAKFGGMTVSEAKLLKALEDKNAKLKKLLAVQMLDLAAMKDLVSKKWYGLPLCVKPSHIFGLSMACRSGGTAKSSARIGR